MGIKLRRYGLNDNNKIGIYNHDELNHRNYENAHPIGAITGLQTALDENNKKIAENKQSVIDIKSEVVDLKTNPTAIVSNDKDNELEVHDNGLYVKKREAIITVKPTKSIEVNGLTHEVNEDVIFDTYKNGQSFADDSLSSTYKKYFSYDSTNNRGTITNGYSFIIGAFSKGAINDYEIELNYGGPSMNASQTGTALFIVATADNPDKTLKKDYLTIALNPGGTDYLMSPDSNEKYTMAFHYNPYNGDNTPPFEYVNGFSNDGKWIGTTMVSLYVRKKGTIIKAIATWYFGMDSNNPTKESATQTYTDTLNIDLNNYDFGEKFVNPNSKIGFGNFGASIYFKQVSLLVQNNYIEPKVIVSKDTKNALLLEDDGLFVEKVIAERIESDANALIKSQDKFFVPDIVTESTDTIVLQKEYDGISVDIVHDAFLGERFCYENNNVTDYYKSQVYEGYIDNNETYMTGCLTKTVFKDYEAEIEFKSYGKNDNVGVPFFVLATADNSNKPCGKDYLIVGLCVNTVYSYGLESYDINGNHIGGPYNPTYPFGMAIYYNPKNNNQNSVIKYSTTLSQHWGTWSNGQSPTVVLKVIKSGANIKTIATWSFGVIEELEVNLNDYSFGKTFTDSPNSKIGFGTYRAKGMHWTQKSFISYVPAILKANAIISPDENNVLKKREDGLFVEKTQSLNGLQVADSKSSKITKKALDNDEVEISAEVLISPDEGNVLIEKENGLFVDSVAIENTEEVVKLKEQNKLIRDELTQLAQIIDTINREVI